MKPVARWRLASAEDEEKGEDSTVKRLDINVIADERESGSPDHRRSVVALRIARGDNAADEEVGNQAESPPAGDGGAEGKAQKGKGWKSRRQRASESIEGKTTQDLASELEHRSRPMKWATRTLLAAFALLVLLPEPLQDLLLEEGLPIGFAFFVLADTGVHIELKLVEIFAKAVMLLAIILLLLSLILIVQRSIVRKVELLKRQGATSEI